ncbi:MAG TPA: inositol monophosphatase [Candidatus Veblenbacteria bacterium]|nr:inositol monophosphatase [Candidatus Veblenbacteria bacterium]
MTSRLLAILAVKKAGTYLRQQFKQDARVFALKSAHEIVTQADKGAEKIILALLKKHSTNARILSEESGLYDYNSNWLWVVDPLDGTTNFRVHNPLFSISLALYHIDKPMLGVVYAPYLDELFVAEKGKGATLNGKRIHVSKTSELKKSFLTYCYGTHPKHMRMAVELYRYFKMKSVDMRQMGSAAVELAWVATGRTESIVIPGTHPWDAAAGVLLVTEAGGKTTDFSGKPWRFVDKKTRKIRMNADLLATNGKIHQKILQHLK